MSEFLKVFKRVIGGSTLKDYARSHVLMHAAALTAMEGTSKKSLEIVQESVFNKIVRRLRKENAAFIAEFRKGDAERSKLPHVRSNKVWVCWLQGIGQAPDIVKRCYSSLLDHLTDREIILLSKDNYRDWVTFPDYIQEKIDQGIIGSAHASDLLRLELLEHYGGTWIDATIFCSGNDIPDYIWNSDLFLYQIMRPGLDGHAQRTSNWFITACTNEPVLRLVKELLYRYWQNHNRAVDYYIFHDFLELAIETYPEIWKKVVPVSSSIPHILLFRLEDPYDDKIWQAAKKMTPFHKLSWKFTDEQLENMKQPGTFYRVVLFDEKKGLTPG